MAKEYEQVNALHNEEPASKHSSPLPQKTWYSWTKLAPGHIEAEPVEKHLDLCMCLSITTFNQKP